MRDPNDEAVRQIAGSMTLSGMALSEKDMERIRYLLDHPEEEDALLKGLIAKHQQKDTDD